MFDSFVLNPGLISEAHHQTGHIHQQTPGVERTNGVIKKKNGKKSSTEIQMGIRCKKLGAWAVGVWHTGCSKKPWLCPLPSVCVFQRRRWMWRTMTAWFTSAVVIDSNVCFFYSANIALSLSYILHYHSGDRKKRVREGGDNMNMMR